MKSFRVIFISLCFSLVGCSEPSTEQELMQTAVAIERSDECHLCGMIISQYPGPKGEMYRQEVTTEHSNTVKKFCSTRDLFSFYLDPENTRNMTKMFVHDMSKSPWENTDDQYFIDASQAWYVVGSSKNGSMGMTLASFSTEKHAQAFSQEYGGEVLSFSQITTQTLNQSYH